MGVRGCIEWWEMWVVQGGCDGLHRVVWRSGWLGMRVGVRGCTEWFGDVGVRVVVGSCIEWCGEVGVRGEGGGGKLHRVVWRSGGEG